MKNHFASAATILLVLMCLLSQRIAFADTITMQEVQSGSLLTQTEEAGRYHSLPVLATEVDIAVSGLHARTSLQQTFYNASDQWLEAVYVFPLPDNGSADALQIETGERVTKGKIQTRQQAQKTYQTAKRQGKRASLLERQRPNLFTTNVANIGPNETITVSISYQSRVRYDDGAFSLRFPLTITPRYQPGQRLQHSRLEVEQTLSPASSGWIILPSQQGRQAPAQAAKTVIRVDIAAGTPLSRIDSGSHRIQTKRHNDHWNITLAENRVTMDRDFELTWYPEAGSSPLAAVFRKDRTEPEHQDSFASLMLIPPQNLFTGTGTAREVIFVIDTSGSMQGNSIRQARKALVLGIERLTDRDTFNVIAFNSTTRTLFPSSRVADVEHRAKATRWVKALHASGGTEIAAAMSTALRDTISNELQGENQVRQIVFVTDGSVSNEDQIYHQIEQTIKDSRLFTVGIGSAPNTWFMRKAAELGRGSYTFIARENEVNAKMIALFHKLERPVLTEVSLQWTGVDTPEIYPATVPDLYAGEAVLADARWHTRIDGGELVVSGKHAGTPWSRKLDLASIKQVDNAGQSKRLGIDNGLEKRWAHRKIESLEDSLLFGADPYKVKQQITDTALEYSLVTRYTSLVAVEEKVARDPATEALKIRKVPSAMPAGNTMNLPQGSAGIAFRFLLSIVFSLLAVLFSLATLKQTRSL